ncbi:MAG: hypothetical protein ACTHMR_18575 [Thermomicrobiales bacterium]
MAIGDWRVGATDDLNAATGAPPLAPATAASSPAPREVTGALTVAGRLLDRWASPLVLLLCAGLTYAIYGQALHFAFTFDDPLDLPRAEGRSVWSMFSSSAGYSYYRPVPFVIWKGLRALQGHYSEFMLHGLTLVAHILAAWLLYLLLRRLTGTHWGVVPAILFITYPFSYQAVFGAHTLFHPLMTALLLLALVLYYDARRLWIVGCGLRIRGLAPQDSATPSTDSVAAIPQPPPTSRFPVRNPHLLLSLLATIVALWTHESGVVIFPLIVGLELLIVARTLDDNLFRNPQSTIRNLTWWPLLYGVAAGVFLVVWKIVPKFPRTEPWTPDSLVPNARYFLQGVIWPVAADLNPLGARWHFDPVRALWPAITGTLVVLIVLYVLGRRPWTPLIALGAAGIILVPAWLLLTWAYLEDAPRLLYPAAPAIAALWGLLPALRFRWRPLTWGWRVVSLAALLAVTIQSVSFISVRRDMWAQGTVLIHGLADTAAAHGDRPLLFLNVPAWFAPKHPEYPIGHVGLTALPGYVGLGRSVYIHRGVQPPLESRAYYPDVNGWKYDFNAHGTPASLDDFAKLLRQVDAVYAVTMLPSGPTITEAGSVQPGGAARNPTGPRFGQGLYLTAARLDLQGNTLAADLTWDVLAPPSGDFAPVLRVRDGSGRVVAERQKYPIADIAAPRLWQPGDHVHDLPALQLPANLASGEYTIWLDWEEHTNHTPLPGVDAGGTPLPANGLQLGRFTNP